MINLDGQPLSRVCFDYAITLIIGSEAEVTIEAPAVLTKADGVTITIKPDAPGAAASELVNLSREVIRQVRVEGNGTLTIAFESGARISVPSSELYEAWGVVGRDGSRVISNPGGGETSWE